MNTRVAAHVSLTSIFVLLLISFSYGFQIYNQTERAIIADLNQALQRTIMQNSSKWISIDTLKTYSHLSSVFGNPVSIESYNQEFSEALSFAEIKEKTGIIVQVKNKKETANPQPVTGKELSKHYLASDTVIWISANPGLPGSMHEDIGISFQGYANYSPFEIFRIMDKKIPGLFLILSFIAASVYFWLRRFRTGEEERNETDEPSVVFGNLSLAQHKASFYKEDGEKLKLTPQQYDLMEMFFRSSTHILTRSEICDTLWPGKMNADETLNTLVRRLRPLVEDNSNLKITTDRGRAYVLEIAAS